MTASPGTNPAAARQHLVERALEALGGAPGGAPGSTPAGNGPAAPPPSPASPGAPSLAERALQALGEAGAIAVPPPSPVPGAAPPASALSPAPSPAKGPPAGLAMPAIPAKPRPATGMAVASPIGLDTLRRAGLVTDPADETQARLLEEVSLIQNQILRTSRAAAPAEEGRSRRIILVTSARPGEGKTFSALNIAADIARSGARPVVLLDADGKKGGLSDLLGLSRVPGLKALIADPMRRPETLLVPTGQRALSILAYGAGSKGEPEGSPAPEGPGEKSPGEGPAGGPAGKQGGGQAVVPLQPAPPAAMLAAAALRIARALPGHLLVLDSPPCLSSSVPSTLAPAAGQVVMVVAAESTQRSEVESALDMVESCPVLQLLLNRVRLTSSDSFGAYGTYSA